MSRKQEIYTEILRLTLPVARNYLSQQFLFGKSLYNAYKLSELSHNLYLSILKPDFGEHDIYFLNFQARYFYENGKESPYYKDLTELIKELFTLIPDKLKNKLNWDGP